MCLFNIPVLNGLDRDAIAEPRGFTTSARSAAGADSLALGALLEIECWATVK